MISRLDVLNKEVSKHEVRNAEVISKLGSLAAVLAQLKEDNERESVDHSSYHEEEQAKVKTFSLISRPVDRRVSSPVLVSQTSPSSIQLNMHRRLEAELKYSVLLQAHVEPLKKGFKINCVQSFNLIHHQKEWRESKGVQSEAVKAKDKGVQSKVTRNLSLTNFFVTFHPNMPLLPKINLVKEQPINFQSFSLSKEDKGAQTPIGYKSADTLIVSPAILIYRNAGDNAWRLSESLQLEKDPFAIHKLNNLFHRSSESLRDNARRQKALEDLFYDIGKIKEKVGSIETMFDGVKSSFATSLRAMKNENIRLANQIEATKNALTFANCQLSKVTGLNAILTKSVPLAKISMLFIGRVRVGFESIRNTFWNRSKHLREIVPNYGHSQFSHTKQIDELQITGCYNFISHTKVECESRQKAPKEVANIHLFDRPSVRQFKSRTLQSVFEKWQLKLEKREFEIDYRQPSYTQCKGVISLSAEKSLFSVFVFRNEKRVCPKVRESSQAINFRQSRNRSSLSVSKSIAFSQVSKPSLMKQFASSDLPLRLLQKSKNAQPSSLAIDRPNNYYVKASVRSFKLSSSVRPVVLLNHQTRNQEDDLASAYSERYRFQSTTKISRLIDIDRQMCLFFKESTQERRHETSLSPQQVFSFTQNKYPLAGARQVSPAFSVSLQRRLSIDEPNSPQKKGLAAEGVFQSLISECNCDSAAIASKLEVENKRLTAVFYIREMNLKNELSLMRRKIDGFKSEPSISHTLKEMNQVLSNEKQALEAKLMIIMAEKEGLFDRFNREVEKDNIHLRSLLSVAESRVEKLDRKLCKAKKSQTKLSSRLETLLPLIKIVIEQVFLESASSFASIFDVCTSKRVFDADAEQLTKKILLALENVRRADRVLYSPSGVLRNPKNIQDTSSAWLLVISERQQNQQLSREKNELRSIIKERVN